MQNNFNKLFGCEHYTDDNLDCIKQTIYRTSSEIFKQWKKSNRTNTIFYRNNAEWLNKPIYDVSKYTTTNNDELLPSTS